MKPPLHDASAAAGLFARYVEGALSPEELAALETSLHQDEKLRGALADWLHLEGILRAEADTLFQEAAAGDTGSRRVIRFPSPWRWAAVAALLCLGVGAGLGRWLRPAPVEIVEKAAPASAPAIGEENVSAVATLADTRACKWGSGSLPTAEGSRLTAGHLELVEGLATLRFDSGATVTLEAPVALEIVDAMECRLARGAAVAWVPEGAKGFRILTPDAQLTDYGTRFGVTANEEGNSQVLVLEGEVGVTHHLIPGERLLKTGEMVRYNAEKLLETDGGDAETPRFADRRPPLPAGWIALTTADGRGQDTCVRQGDGGAPYGDSPLIMVKNSTNSPGNRRKGYLRFDLATLGGKPILGAELVLSLQASGLGYASVVPDATFRLYGLVDSPDDENWEAATMRWDEAPANVTDDGVALDPARAVPLGDFVVEQGVSSGQRTVTGAALEAFLKADHNGLVTFVLVRLTDETDRHGLVHAFASREHPLAMPPTLRLKLQ